MVPKQKLKTAGQNFSHCLKSTYNFSLITSTISHSNIIVERICVFSKTHFVICLCIHATLILNFSMKFLRLH